jgi:hypothetical protein
VVLALLVGFLLTAGFGFFGGARQIRLHRGAAFGVAGVVALHGVGGALHALTPPREPAPLILVALGTAIAVLVGWLLWDQGRRLEGMPRRARSARHTVAGLVVGFLALAHVILGVIHAITG